MARSYNTPPSLPNTLGLAALEPILAVDLEDLSGTVNHAIGQGRAQNVISQGWGDSSFADNSAALGFRCEWTVPKVADTFTKLKCMVDAVHNAASTGIGRVEFRAVNSGSTCLLAILPGGRAYVDSQDGAGAASHLDLSFVGGVETVEMWSSGDATGTYATTIHGVDCGMISDPSPLGIDAPGLDTGQVIQDSHLSSHTGHKLLEDIDDVEGRPRVYFTWSTAQGITVGARDLSNAQNRRYLVMTPRPVGSGLSANQGYTLNYRIKLGDVAENTRAVLFAAARDQIPFLESVTRAAGAPGWQTGTLTAAEYLGLRNTIIPFCRMGLSPTLGALQSLTIWGR